MPSYRMKDIPAFCEDCPVKTGSYCTLVVNAITQIPGNTNRAKEQRKILFDKYQQIHDNMEIDRLHQLCADAGIDYV